MVVRLPHTPALVGHVVSEETGDKLNLEIFQTLSIDALEEVADHDVVEDANIEVGDEGPEPVEAGRNRSVRVCQQPSAGAWMLRAGLFDAKSQNGSRGGGKAPR